MIFHFTKAAPYRRALIVSGMVAVLSSAAFAASAEVTPAPVAGLNSNFASGVLLAACKPPRKQEGCVRDPCTGNYICCDKTSGGLSCVTLRPKSK